MKKKTVGLVISALIIGSLVVMMVKSNLATNEPDIEYLIGADYNMNDQDDVGLKQGDLPPDFTLPTLSGEEVKLSDLQGKKVILNFWASWCGPCRAEMPHMEKYYKKYKEKDNVEIVAVNLSTTERRGLKGVKEFKDSYKLTFPILLDEEGWAIDAYQIKPIPTTYLIHTDGTIAHKIVGPMDEKMMKELVRRLH
ncbi:peroxiredoxin [Sporosarcina sp. HYO08]|uniref:peroxiredoxin family protein n=1 Tax=Sporosarcina sp. HYO08 TaxID=1759557 RepID=UPI00079A01CE|nr:redoxin domain-containing protein [Sporosarcina sp. HYO08]KXH79748.1 thiol-disulfide oxidoreductase [Sporosarcina sp. HYO08]